MRKLLEKFKLLKEMFGQYQSMWSSLDDPFKVVHSIFDNNPYIDGFIDSFRVTRGEARSKYSGTNAKLGTNAVHHSHAR